MNTYSRRRRTFLSLLLSVAMVLSYSTAFLGTSVENVYADNSLISLDRSEADENGVLHLELEKGYVQEDSWLRVFYASNADMDPLGDYVYFELEQPENFGCEFYPYPDQALEAGERSGVTITPPADLDIGAYNLTLKVYEDATGTGNFEGAPTETIDLVIDVVPRKPFNIDLWAEAINMQILEGFEPERGEGEFELQIMNFDAAFTGESILPHIKFDFTGDNADCFEGVAGLEGLTFESPEEPGTTAILSVKPVPGLDAGEYNAELNVYIDNTGMQVLDTPCKTIPVHLTVNARMEYDFTMEVDNYGVFEALPLDYTSADIADNTATITIRNTGKKDLSIDPSQLIVVISDVAEEDIKSEEFTVGFLKDTPFTLEAGKSVELATVTPTTGLEQGLHKAFLDFAVDFDGMWSSANYPIEVCVLKDTASLVYQDGPIDFGAVPPGFGEEDQGMMYVSVMNDGNVPLEITSVTKPENGPFADATGYGWIIPGGATAGFDVSLDAYSQYADELGTYEGNYVVTAKECDDEGNIVEGGSTVTVKVPVKVEITNTLPASFRTNVMSGPHSEPLSIYTKTGYDSSEATTSFSIEGSYGEHFYGREIGDFVKFGLDETSAELITIEGFDPKEPLPDLGNDEVGYKEVKLSLVEGLESGCYEANVYMYVDPKGTGTFDDDNPTEVIPVTIQVEEGNAFDILSGDADEFRFVLEQGYSEEDAAASAQSVVVRNCSKSDLVIENPDALHLWSEDEAFEISCDGDFPITIKPGESQTIAAITPLQALDAGKYTAWVEVEADGKYNSKPVTLTVVKNEASIRWQDKEIDFGYLRTGFAYEDALEKSVSVSVLNDGNTPLRVTDVTASNASLFRVMAESEDSIVNSGEEFVVQIMPEAYGGATTTTGTCDGEVTVCAQECDKNGELVEGGKTLQAKLPVHFEITDEAYSITIDMQGHGENKTLAGIMKGTYIADVVNREFGEDWPTTEDYVFFGFNGKPLSSYNSWDEYLQDDDSDLYRPLVTDTTVYAGWLTEYTGAVNLTLEAPKCGTSAKDSAPKFAAPSGSQYTVEESSWSEDTDSWEPYTGTFVGGEEYIAAVDLQPEYLYCFPTEAPPQIFVNGEEIDTSFSRGGLISMMVRMPVRAEHSLIKTEAVEATCEEEGNIEYWTCEGCGKVFSDAEGKNEIQQADTVVEKTGHALTKTEEVPAACTKEGTEAYWTCSVCHKMFSDAKGTKEIEAPVAIPKTDKHSWGEWKTTKEATTSTAGEKVRECSACHKTEKQVIPKKPETKYSDGWQSIGGEWYYYKNNAKVTNGWAKDSVGWCYLGADGRMTRNAWVTDSHGWCWIGADGYWVTGSRWISCNGGWYYIRNGYMVANAWQKDSVGWCYLGSDGKMVTNGWARDSYGWCWLGSNGYWTSNIWVLDNGEWYYIKPNHYMAANEWARDSAGWMYMAASGKVTRSQWIKDGSYWYYLKADGYMATGTQTIDGQTYVFDSSGVWVR